MELQSYELQIHNDSFQIVGEGYCIIRRASKHLSLAYGYRSRQLFLSYSCNMEDIGHKLMAFRIDEQLLGILYSQINQALEKLGATNTLNLEGKAAVELAFYLLSFGISIHGSDEISSETPGMQAVGLSVQSEATGTTLPTRTVNLLRSVLILSLLTVKWSTSKLRDISTLGGWFAYPQVPCTLRTYPNKCQQILRSIEHTSVRTHWSVAPKSF